MAGERLEGGEERARRGGRREEGRGEGEAKRIKREAWEAQEEKIEIKRKKALGKGWPWEDVHVGSMRGRQPALHHAEGGASSVRRDGWT